MEGLVNGLYRFSEWAMRFAYLNFLWVIFTLLGLIVVGFMPATAAMFAVIRKWRAGEKELEIFPLFWKTYRKDFLKINLIGSILLGIGYILSIEFYILRAQEDLFYYVASFGVIVQILLYVVVLIYIFPIFTHFDLKINQYFKWSFIIGIIHPILTLLLIAVMIIASYFLIQTVPALVFFFGGSVSAFIITRGVSLTFSKFEQVEAR